jgi:ectoine hydroxylase-related dioxygenase (phytanoyl-CoA dioxygenase family)
MTHPPDAGSNGPPAPFHEVRIGRDDPAEIRRSYDENGYLFFKGALNADTVLRAKEDIAGVLQQQSYMQKGSAEPRATPGASAVEVDYGPLYRLKSPWELMASPELQEAVDIAYGEKVRVGRSIGFRYSMPTDAPYLTPPHQDHFYIRETDEFRMIWVPLMDMEIANGGLAIAAGSHKHGLQEHVEFDGVYSYFFKGRTQKGVRPEDIHGAWTSSRFELGDLLMFHCCAVHRSLPNVSGLIRLSLNTITYPARRPTMWQAERTGPELEVFREQVKRICDAQGIVGDRFEEIQLMAFKQGEDPSPELVAKLAAQLEGAAVSNRRTPKAG